MRKFRDLVEAKDTIVFAFGRFNPPTTGHEKLIQKVAQVAGSNPYRIYPSYTTNPKKDPLPHALKVAYMRKMFKKYAKNIIADKDAKTAIMIAEKLFKEGFKNLVMVAGSDRVKEFSTLLNRYNDAPDKKGNQLFKFDSVEIVSAGERDPDAEGVEGMSASKMRAAATEGDYNSFSTGIPATLSDADKKKLYRDVRKYMGIREERDMGDDYDSLRDAYLTGKIWNVGTIIEANGLTGEIVRKGANYLSFMTEDGKVHKAWLHEIELNEEPITLTALAIGALSVAAKVGIDLIAPHAALAVSIWWMLPVGISTASKLAIAINVAAWALPSFLAAIGSGASIMLALKNTQKKVKSKIDGMTPQEMNKLPTKPSDKADILKVFKKGKVKTAIKEDIELVLDERNYAKEYQNYHSRPEQIARRSSRNKARRVMGDKTKIGMDVGHKDNDPMNNDPTNLRNEDPSKNRREPRLRNKELDESPIPWLDAAMARIHQITHPKAWDKIVKDYVDGLQEPEHRAHPSKWAVDVARRYRDVDGRALIKYINTLVMKGKLPKELKAEYVPEQISFKDMVDKIQEGAYGYERQDSDIKDKEGTQPAKYYKDLSKSTKKKRDAHFKAKKSGPAPGDADAETEPSVHTKKFKQMYGEALPKDADMGDYIDDFQKSDSPQFKGKSEKKRKEMAIAAYLSKQRNESVDDLQHPKVKEKPVDHLSGDWEDIDVPAPAENSSEETLEELMAIKKLSENRTKEDENSIKEHDMAVTWSIRNYLKENDLEYDTDVMSKLVQTGQGLSRHFKNKFLRPRPFQLAKELDMDLEPMEFPSDTMKTPSYPSGHSLQSRLVAEFYAKKYPEHKKGLIAAAEECGLGRVKAGWHYPSDHKVGVMIAEAAAPMIDSTIEEDSPCWSGFKQVGMKKKNGKNVPNCVPEEVELDEKVKGLINKSEKSGIAYGILKKVYDRGLAAYKTGHRPGTTAPQWAFARVNSFITGGGARKSDNDLWKQHKEEFNEWGELEEKAEYQGKKVTLNKPFYTPDGPKKSAVYVTGPKGDPVIVRFGDKDMEIKVDDPARRKSFRARHNCDNPGPKWKARYWSCKAW